MPLQFQKLFRKNFVFVKVTLIILAIFAVVIACSHIWLIHNTNRLLIELISNKSSGKLKLDLSHASFDLFSSEIKIHQAKIASTGKDKNKITYQVSFRKVTISTNSLWEILFKNSLEIKKVKLYDPVIEVFNRQKDTSAVSKKDLSLGMELGKFYHSIEEAITALNTHSISLINAKLIINNKIGPGKEPLIFSNIYFTLKKLNKPKNRAGRYLDNNNILFSSSNQDISFSDGIHKLLFKRLVIEKARNIIMDSCTIIALPTLTSHSSYNIHFKRLALIGVDFDALSKTNLIKADSVYCVNPFSNVDLNSGLPGKTTVARGMPDPSKILKDFTGNLDLGFVGVMNGDIHMNITGKRKLSNIHSGRVNFQIQKLRINPDSIVPFSISSFDMLIKGYRLYNADSTCVYSFDSIRFANDKLLLNNFTVHTSSGVDKIRNFRDYSMPYFELLGVDWTELIFKQSLKATEAVLHDPIINYTKIKTTNLLKRSIIFNSRQTLDDFMEIGRLKIINGTINVKWATTNSLQLQGLNLSLLGNNFVNYKRLKLKKDIETLLFRSGYLKMGNITAGLSNVTFTTNDQIHAEEVLLKGNSAEERDSKLNDVSIRNIYTEPGGKIVINGLEWKHGDITVNAIPLSKERTKSSSILFKNISGNQTQFRFFNNEIEANAFVENVQISTLEKNNEYPMLVEGLKVTGKEMNFSKASLKVNSGDFILSDSLQQFSEAGINYSGDSRNLSIRLPLLKLTDNIHSFLAKDFHFKDVLLKSPVIDFQKQNNSLAGVRTASKIPGIRIDHLMISEPVISVKKDPALSNQHLLLSYSKGSEIKGEDVQIAADGITIGALDMKAQNVEMGNEIKVLKVDNGINVNLTKVNIPANSDSSWSAALAKLNIKNSENYVFNIQDNKLELKDITVENCLLSSVLISDIKKLISSNDNVQLSTSAVKYYAKNSSWQGFDVSYNAAGNLLMLDSLNYHPYLSRDSAISSSPYQTDYITFNSGKATFHGFNINKYLSEKSLAIQKASFINPSIVAYRDKLPPFLPGIRKKLFVELAKDISSPLSIKEIEISGGKVSYIEKQAKTRLEGNLILTRLNGNIANFKSYDFKNSDSLSLVFNGHLQDNANFDLEVNQSYVDPLYGFQMNLRIEPASLSFLNPLLAPLSNIKFNSGNIDKFEMNATGNENFARGEMKFYYHDLQIELLKNGGIAKSTFIKRTASALVNTFVLRRNNHERTGLIYFERLKDRSFFNYMSKIIFTGASTSVGAKKNRYYKKKITKSTLNKKNTGR